MDSAHLPGRTEVPVEVIAKIASQAAAEVPGTGAASGGFLGIGARRDFTKRPEATAEVLGSQVVLDLDLGLEFGLPIGPTTERVREHVAGRVEELVGLPVEQVDITVSWVADPGSTTGGLR